MRPNICIDWGNRYVKVALFHGEEEQNMLERWVFSSAEAGERLEEILQNHQPAKGILCTVTEESREWESLLDSSLKAFLKLNNDTRVPMMNAYTSSETLGADRLGLAVGAHSLYPQYNNLVICLGTCITYNFIQKGKAFRGGAISPGLQMRLDALHHFTSQLPRVSLNGETLLLGYDTETCIRGGAVFGMAAEIDGMIEAYSAQYSDFNAILTGGDAPFFEGKIKSKIFADPDLLLKGLQLILNYNVPTKY